MASNFFTSLVALSAKNYVPSHFVPFQSNPTAQLEILLFLGCFFFVTMKHNPVKYFYAFGLIIVLRDYNSY